MGFIRFGTLAHRILLAMRDYGPQCNRTLAMRFGYELKDAHQAIGANLCRLARNKFIFNVGNYRSFKTRSSVMFHYDPTMRVATLPRKTPQERTRDYRARKKIATSVFDFRGSIELNVPEVVVKQKAPPKERKVHISTPKPQHPWRPEGSAAKAKQLQEQT